MKTNQFKIGLLAIYLIFSSLQLTFAQDSEAKKNINKTFNLSLNDEVKISNRFGMVHVNTWDKNSVEFKIEILVKSSSAKKSQEMMEELDVKIEKNSDGIFAETNCPKSKNGSNKSTEFEINYTVNMPKNNVLRLKNKFGDVYIATMNAEVKLDIQFGNGKIDQLNNVKNDVESSFSELSIGFIKNGNIETQHGKLFINEAENLNLKTQFTKIEIDKIKNLNIDGQHGKIEIDEITNLTGEIQFSPLDIEKLYNKLDLESNQHAKIEVEWISKNFEKINLPDAQFANVELHFEDGTNIRADIENQFGDIDFPSSANVIHSKKTHTNKHYEIEKGKSLDAPNVLIAGQFGNIELYF